MIQVPINQVKEELSRYLRLAATNAVIITQGGVPAGMLVGFEDPEDWWEELVLRDPRFKTRVAEARQSLREGKGITLEQFRAKHNLRAAEAPKKRRRATNKKSVVPKGRKSRGAKATRPP